MNRPRAIVLIHHVYARLYWHRYHFEGIHHESLGLQVQKDFLDHTIGMRRDYDRHYYKPPQGTPTILLDFHYLNPHNYDLNQPHRSHGLENNAYFFSNHVLDHGHKHIHQGLHR